MGHPLWVVIPAYNEQASLGATLRRLAEQDDRAFTLVVVDNASTDRTAETARAYAADLDLHLISEPEKGTGCSCTGRT